LGEIVQLVLEIR